MELVLSDLDLLVQAIKCAASLFLSTTLKKQCNSVKSMGHLSFLVPRANECSLIVNSCFTVLDDF